MNLALFSKKFVLYFFLALYSTIVVYGQKIPDVSQLPPGTNIQIYPHNHFREQKLALSCNGNELTSAEEAGRLAEACIWTIVDAGDGSHFYLKNNLGYYWAYQDNEPHHSLTCTKDIDSAIGISFTWDNSYKGICFWNQKDGKGLNNLNGYNRQYNWYSDPSSYDSDSNTTFDIYAGEDFESTKEIEDSNIKYLLISNSKIAKVLRNDYEGDIVIPQYVKYDGIEYKVNNIDACAFMNCNNLISVSCGDIENIGSEAFLNCSNLSSATFGNVGNIENSAFQNCSNLSSATFGNVGNIENSAFLNCNKLSSASFENIEKIGDNAFWNCFSLIQFTIPSELKSLSSSSFRFDDVTLKCYVVNPDDIKVKGNIYTTPKRIYVPKSSLEDYKNTNPWANFADRIYPMGETPITKINLPETARIKVKGEEGKIQLIPTISPENADIQTLEWSSSDESIVTVDKDGYVVGVNVGEAVITAKAMDGSEVSTNCKVTVGALNLESISFWGMPSKIDVGKYIEKVTEKVRFYPEDADYTSLNIETSDPTVLRYYNTDKLYAKKAGSATVTATATLPDNTTVSTSCYINVIGTTNIENNSSDEMSINVNAYTLKISGVDDGAPITVASAQGSMIYHGTLHTCKLPGAGVYIVNISGKALTVTVK